MYSKYNIYIKDYPKQFFTTIYNLLTNEMVCYADKNLFPNPSRVIEKKLEKAGICCTSQSDELIMALNKYEEIVNSNDELVIVLLLTSSCNCKCVYCYESDLQMDFTDFYNSDDIVRFISEKMCENNIKDLRVVFYGGEPLLNKNAITDISSKLKYIYDDRYKFSIVTNGTLINSPDIDKWVKMGLLKVKITLDGAAPCHDGRRPFKNGEGTYNLIVQNLEKLNGRVKILINIIIDEELFGVTEMLRDLKKRKIDSTFSLSFREPAPTDMNTKANLMIKFSKILKQEEVDFQTNIKAKHGVICQLKRKNYYVVDGKGQVFGCEANLSELIGNTNFPVKKVKYKLKKTCQECKFLPICYGECAFTPICQKQYFEQLLPELLKIYIQAK